MDVITKLIKNYNDHVNKNMSSLSRLLLLNIHDTAGCTIYELADKCFSSPTAISRFVKHLEYTGFSQYKYFVWETLNSYYKNNRVVPLTKNAENASVIHDYVKKTTKALQVFENNVAEETILRICEKIAEAKDVLCISPEIGNFLILQYDLFLQGKTTHFPYGLAETEECIKDMGPDTFALIFIPPERESARMKNVLQTLQDKDIPMAMLAGSSYRGLQQYSDLIVTYDATGTNLDNVMFNTFMDVITISYRKKYIDKE